MEASRGERRSSVRVVAWRAERWCAAAPLFAQVLFARVSSPVAVVGCGLHGIIGVPAARSPRALPLALSRRRRPRHGLVRHRSRVIAGTTPMRAGRRASGTSVHSSARQEQAS